MGGGVTFAVQFFLGSVAFQPAISPDINALFLVGIFFAPAFETSAAGAVSLAFGALTLRTQVGRVKYGAVAAVLAIVGDALDDLLSLDISALGMGIYPLPLRARPWAGIEIRADRTSCGETF